MLTNDQINKMSQDECEGCLKRYKNNKNLSEKELNDRVVNGELPTYINNIASRLQALRNDEVFGVASDDSWI